MAKTKVFVAVLFCIIPSIITPGTIRVPSDQPTIQAGLNAASHGDTVLVADGTYTGLNNKDLDFNGKAITVRSEDGPANCVIDCQDQGRGFYFHSGEGLVSCQLSSVG